MTGTFRTTVRLLAITFAALLLAACSQIGRQEPKVFQGMFSSSGHYYAYVYGSVFVWSYERKGGSTRTQGSVTYYLQIVDADTGQRLLAEPFELDPSDCRYPRVEDVNDTHALLSCRGKDGNKATAPMVFSIAARKVAFLPKAILSANPGLPLVMDAGGAYRNAEQPEAFFVEGSDGRKYRLDPATGTAQPAQGTFERADHYSEQERGRLPKGLGEYGDGRTYIADSRDQARRSQADFLRPKYLFLGEERDNDDDRATLFDGGFLVFSRTDKSSGQNKLLTSVDAETLATRWETPLPQRRGNWANDFDNERFALRGDQLLMTNSSQWLQIDPASGKIVRNVNLVD